MRLWAGQNANGDPENTTTERTLALPSRSKYSFEIVHLEEVVVRKVPKVVEYVPC